MTLHLSAEMDKSISNPLYLKPVMGILLICLTVVDITTLTILYKPLPLLLKTDGKALKGGDETPRL